MKIMYATDLHGHKWKYKKILEILDHDMLIIGADILPKHTDDNHYHQKKFILEYLPKFFDQVKVPMIIDFGNDDFFCFYGEFKNVIHRYNNVYCSHLKEVKINDISFIGMHFVPDYPFGLKDWCRRDGDRFEDPQQIGHPVTAVNHGYFPIIDLYDYLRRRISIDDALEKIKSPNKKNVVYLIHSPPRTIGLDVTGNRQFVGSMAVTKFLIKNKPLLSLHGHIHESPWISGISINSLVKGTVQIQPGQRGGHKSLAYCEFDLNNIEGSYKRTVI